MSLDEEIKVLHDFIFSHEPCVETHKVYREMVTDMQKRYSYTEQMLLHKVIDYRQEKSI